MPVLSKPLSKTWLQPAEAPNDHVSSTAAFAENETTAADTAKANNLVFIIFSFRILSNKKINYFKFERKLLIIFLSNSFYINFITLNFL